MIVKHQDIAVLTGDLVASTTLGEARIARAFQALADSAALQAAWHGAPLRFTRHRGDGWQVALARPALALRSALAFRAALRAEGDAFESYIAIAVGAAPDDFGASLNDRSEAVFVGSGRGLDALKTMTLPVRFIHDRGGAVGAATLLADHISQGWTQVQASAVLPTLDPEFDGTYTGIAKRLGKSRQAVTKSLRAAGQEVIAMALETLEKGAEHD